MAEIDATSTAASGAVFLSYASDDIEAVRRIAAALRALGVEVWFDEDELAGGDAWDAKIRQQIKNCALFVPVISGRTEARTEGYFRLEWRLADQRTHLMGRAKAFLLPVCIDQTKDAGADVPDSFLAYQWMRLPNGEVTPAFTARVRTLLAGNGAAAVAAQRPPAPASVPAPAPAGKRASWWPMATVGVLAAGTVGGFLVWRQRQAAAVLPPPSAAASVAVPPAPAPASSPLPAPATPVALAAPIAAAQPPDPELRRARELIEAPDAIAEDYALAEEIAQRALAQRPDDPAALIVCAEAENQFLLRGYDPAAARSAAARKFAERAVLLAPDDPDALDALASCLAAARTEGPRAESLARAAVKRSPQEARYARTLFRAVAFSQPSAGPALIESLEAQFPSDGLLREEIAGFYRDRNQLLPMERALTAALGLAHSSDALVWKAWLALWWRSDVGAMGQWLERVPARQAATDRVVFARYVQAYVSDRPALGLKALNALPEDWLTGFDYTGPKGLLVGDLLALQGRKDLAQLQYAAALAALAREKARDPTALAPRRAELWTLYRLGRIADARACAQLLMQSARRPFRLSIREEWWFDLIAAQLELGDRDQALALIHETQGGPQERLLLRNMLRLDPRLSAWRRDPAIAPLLVERPANPTNGA
jgi:hypothetical protein